MNSTIGSAPDVERYDAVARSLHWAGALLVVAGFVMGLMADVPPKPLRPLWLNIHVLVGFAVLAIALVRLGWRAGHRPPAIVAGTGPLLALAARLGHAGLYAAMIVVPLIGLAPLFARGRGIDFGLFQIASPIARTPEWIKPSTEVHEIAAYAMIALAAGHVLAALWHQFALRDGLLLRMTPPRRG